MYKDSKISFKTTEKKSGEYNYQEHTWDLSNQLRIDDVLELSQFSKFEYAGKIIRENNSAGYVIDIKEKFKNESFAIYLLVIDGYVLKGGKAKNGINNRSYSAGTEENWTMRGTPSSTNYIWSQIFRQMLKDDINVEFYGYLVPSMEYTYESFNGIMVTENVCGHYETEEKKLNKMLKEIKGSKLIGEGGLEIKNKK